MSTILTEKDFQKPEQAAPTRIVKFTNFSKEDFTHTWNKIPYTFKAGEDKYMEAGIADHFAKHLINRELLRRGRESDTSPKLPSDNPFYMELYERCIEPVETPEGPVDQTKIEQDVIDRNMRAQQAQAQTQQTENKEDFEEVPVDDDDDAPPAEQSNMADKGQSPEEAKREQEMVENGEIPTWQVFLKGARERGLNMQQAGEEYRALKASKQK